MLPKISIIITDLVNSLQEFRIVQMQWTVDFDISTLLDWILNLGCYTCLTVLRSGISYPSLFSRKKRYRGF